MRPGNKKIEVEEEVGHQPGEDAESVTAQLWHEGFT